MALSPDATALKEQALHAADTALLSSERPWQMGAEVRALLAAAWLDGYRTAQMESDRYVDEARLYLLSLAGSFGWAGR